VRLYALLLLSDIGVQRFSRAEVATVTISRSFVLKLRFFGEDGINFALRLSFVESTRLPINYFWLVLGDAS